MVVTWSPNLVSYFPFTWDDASIATPEGSIGPDDWMQVQNDDGGDGVFHDATGGAGDYGQDPYFPSDNGGFNGDAGHDPFGPANAGQFNGEEPFNFGYDDYYGNDDFGPVANDYSNYPYGDFDGNAGGEMNYFDSVQNVEYVVQL